MPYKNIEDRRRNEKNRTAKQKAAGTFDYLGARARTRKWRDSHRERKRAYKKAYYWKNRDKILAHLRAKRGSEYNKKREAARRERMAADPDLKQRRIESNKRSYARRYPKIKETVKRYVAANPEKSRDWKRTTSARRRLAKGKYTTNQWLARFSFYGRRCAYCFADLTVKSPHRDHVVPVFFGGTNWASNLVPACKTCNLRKGTKRWLPRMPKPHGVLPR